MRPKYSGWPIDEITDDLQVEIDRLRDELARVRRERDGLRDACSWYLKPDIPIGSLAEQDQRFKAKLAALAAAGGDTPDESSDPCGFCGGSGRLIHGRCRHGVIDRDWCEPCNREYKTAAIEDGGADHDR